MRILITNDDGIHAEGLGVCEQIGRALSDDIWVIAPEYDQSGVSHSLSLNDPLRLRPVRMTDCFDRSRRPSTKSRQRIVLWRNLNAATHPQATEDTSSIGGRALERQSSRCEVP